MVPASDPVTTKLYAHRRLSEPRSGSHLTFQNLAAHSRLRTRPPRDAATRARLACFVLSHLPNEY
jgi:hypothetical protein